MEGIRNYVTFFVKVFSFLNHTLLVSISSLICNKNWHSYFQVNFQKSASWQILHLFWFVVLFIFICCQSTELSIFAFHTAEFKSGFHNFVTLFNLFFNFTFSIPAARSTNQVLLQKEGENTKFNELVDKLYAGPYLVEFYFLFVYYLHHFSVCLH